MKPNPKLVGKILGKIGEKSIVLDKSIDLDISEIDRDILISGWIEGFKQANVKNWIDIIKGYLAIGNLDKAIQLSDKYLTRNLIIGDTLESRVQIAGNLLMAEFIKSYDKNYKQKILNLAEDCIAANKLLYAIKFYEVVEIDYMQPKIKNKILEAVEKLSKEKPLDEDLFSIYRLFDHNKYITLLESAIDSGEVLSDHLMGVFFDTLVSLKNHPKYKKVLKKLTSSDMFKYGAVRNLKKALDLRIPNVTKKMVLDVAKEKLVLFYNNNLSDNDFFSLAEIMKNLGVPESELSEWGTHFFESAKKESDENNLFTKFTTATLLYYHANNQDRLFNMISYLKDKLTNETEESLRRHHHISKINYNNLRLHYFEYLYEAIKCYEKLSNMDLSEKEWRDITNFGFEIIGENYIYRIEKKDQLITLKQDFEVKGKKFLVKLVQKRLEELNKNETKS